MIMTVRFALGLLGTLLLCACMTTRTNLAGDYHPPSGSYRLVVLEPDVTVGEITAGGVFDQRDDWTQQARASILTALQHNQAKRGGETRVAATPEEAGWDTPSVGDLIQLHRQVGTAIVTYKYGPVSLPTKKGRFDWTLGEQAVAFGTATHYDYALFLSTQDSFASGGRRALQVVGMLGCLTGYCVIVSGGNQIAFASLVDLKTGGIVWFNRLQSMSGDIRTPNGAKELVDKLLDGMNGSPTSPGGARTHR
jgi:hypothetical protein